MKDYTIFTASLCWLLVVVLAAVALVALAVDLGRFVWQEYLSRRKDR